MAPDPEPDRSGQKDGPSSVRRKVLTRKAVEAAGGLKPDEFQSNFPEAGKPVSYWEAAKTIKVRELFNFSKMPCAVDSAKNGMIVGAVVGGLRVITYCPIPIAANWAVGTGVLASVMAHEYCRYKLRKEKRGLHDAVKVYTEAQAKSKAQEKLLPKVEVPATPVPEPKSTPKSRLRFW